LIQNLGCVEVDMMHKILLADEVFSNRDKFFVIPVKIWAVAVQSYMSLRLKTLGVRKIVLTTALGETCIPIADLVDLVQINYYFNLICLTKYLYFYYHIAKLALSERCSSQVRFRF